MKRFLCLVSLIFSVCVFSQKVCAESPPDNPAAVIPDYSPVTAYTPEAPSWPLRFAQEFQDADCEFNRAFLLQSSPVWAECGAVIPVLAWHGNYYAERDLGIFKRLCFQSLFAAYNCRKRNYYERFLKLPVAPVITYNT